MEGRGEGGGVLANLLLMFLLLCDRVSLLPPLVDRESGGEGRGGWGVSEPAVDVSVAVRPRLAAATSCRD